MSGVAPSGATCPTTVACDVPQRPATVKLHFLHVGRSSMVWYASIPGSLLEPTRWFDPDVALDAVTSADNPKPRNAPSAAAGPRRSSLNLDTHHIFARAALASGFASFWACPGSSRNTGRVRRRWRGCLRECDGVRHRHDNDKGCAFQPHDFIPVWLVGSSNTDLICPAPRSLRVASYRQAVRHP